ncbi:MAG: twin-arginine translocase subunit TatC [Gammaproteobacteria bacterium]|nr:twin-arginine translocase subunit TatC [Gammaproteobacteria bacterium]
MENENNSAAEQSLMDHLVELRDRLMWIVLVILVAFLVLFAFSEDLFSFAAKPLLAQMPEGTSMIATGVTSPFLVPLKLALLLSVLLTIPHTLHQIWAFVAPGLYKHEKRLAVPLLISSVLLFYCGIAFAHFIILPILFKFFLGVAPEGVAVMTDIGQYLDFMIAIFFAFGLAFEIPVATFLLIAAGATTPARLGEKRPYIIVGAFVIGMLLTPPDVISQTLLAVPMLLLFEGGLIMARIFLKEKISSTEAADNGPDYEIVEESTENRTGFQSEQEVEDLFAEMERRESEIEGKKE